MKVHRRIAGLMFVVGLLLGRVSAQTLLTGVVRDGAGSVVSNATVVVGASGRERKTRTTASGDFALRVDADSGTVRVQAAGFSEAVQNWTAGGGPLTIVLAPLPRSEQVVVTATRTPLATSETGASVDVVTNESRRTSGGVALDDVLRQVTGFSLFRRSSSVTANPTTEGVSLRGVGSSGASRALVLLDGVPASDPFGGWVYWDQVPEIAVGSVEVVRGGASGLYGTDAMGGVINVVTRRPERTFAEVSGELGNAFLRDGAALAGVESGKWRAMGAVQAFDTDGYFVVPADQRGSADTRAAVEYRTGFASVERAISSGRVFVAGSLLGESRNNGTRLQVNDTHLGRIVLGSDFAPGAVGTFAVRVFGTGETYHQTFSSISADRNEEALTRGQTVPSQQLGGTVQWSRVIRAHTMAAGFDFSERRGHTDESVFSSGLATSVVDAGGRTRNLGYFVEDVFAAGARLTLTAALRGDHWINADGHSSTTSLNGASGTSNVFPDRTEAAFSPRFSALYRVSERIGLTASVYRSFRAPTLNELYRAFRVGNVLTLANSDLRAERLTGGEAGVRVMLGNLAVRGVFFDSEITNPVANVTLTSTASLITRKRENLGSTRARGAEIEAEWHVRKVVVSGGYQYTDAVVTSFAANRAIEGRWTPQVPRHQFTGQVRYSASGWSLSAQARAAGVQYDDDQNLLPLDPYFQLDAYVSRQLSKGVEMYVAGENVLGQRAMVGRTPTVTLGPPALVRAGVRLRLGKR